MGLREWSLLLLLAGCWGGSFLFAKLAGREIAPLTLALARVGLAAATLWIVAAGLGQLRRDLPWRAFLVMGLLNNAIPFTLIFWAQTAIAASLASILNAFTPMVTVIVAHVLTRDERLTPAKAVGVALGLAGIVTLVGPGAVRQAGGHPLHELAVIAATLSYALAGIYGRRFRDLPAILPAAGQLTGATLLLAPVVLVAEPGAAPWHWSAPTIGAVAGLALVSTAAAYVLYFRILATAGATNLLLVTFLIPPVAILLGYTLLDERLAGHQFAGLIGIAAGLLVIDGRARMRR
ncbi:MAG: DMT family transporter [Alphaproteobacteria bacterium]|nr:DMT family transporter [Alphaproteobacteria bacterium]